MIVVIIIVFVFLFILSYHNIRNIILKNIVLFFILFWGSALVLSNFNPFGIYNVSDKTYFILLLFVISFVIGTLSLKSYPYNIDYNKNKVFSHLINKIISDKFFILFIILLDAVLLYLYIKELSILQYYSFLEIRKDIDNLLYEGNSFLGLTRNMIILPMTPIITFLGTYMIVYNRKIFPLILVIFFIVTSALLDGSRVGILTILVYCIFMIMCKNVFNVKRVKSRSISLMILKLLPVFLLVFITMSNMTAQREFNIQGFSWKGISLGVSSLSEHFVTYCVGPFRALDYSFQNNYLEQVDYYKFGGCTFGFIEGMFSLVVNALGGHYNPSYRNLATILQDNWILIGDEKSFNFAYTAIIFYYIDFGIIGVIIIPFILGRLFVKIANKFIINNNLALLVLMGYLFTIIIDAIFTWRLYRYQAFMTFVFIYVLYQVYKKYYVR